MTITIKDIARAAGVSHTTVSRALRDHPAIAQETVATIKQLARRMGYVPSATARGLKTRRTQALGVIVSHIDDPFWSEVLQGIDSIVHPAGYSLFLAATHRDKQREKEVVQAMVQRGVDGVIVCAPQFSAAQSRVMQTHGLRMVVVNNEGASASPDLVFNEDGYGIRVMTRHLITLGHRRIAFLGNALGGRTHHRRAAGFRAEMRAAGLSVPAAYLPLAPQGTPAGGLAGAERLLALPQRPTAILCYNDQMAVGVYSAVQQAGLRIPEDISVAGFDDIAIAAYLTPPLTTLHQFKRELGARAAELLLHHLQTPAPAAAGRARPRRIGLKGALVVRASTARPAS